MNPEVERYRRLGDNINKTGVVAMEACRQCEKAKEPCVVKRGYKNCGRCTKKGMKCSGNFSQANFDKLEVKKQELRKEAEQARKIMRIFAKQLLLQEKKTAALEKRLEQLSRRQDALLDQEARALGMLDDAAEIAGDAEEMVFDVQDPIIRQDDPNHLEMPLDLPSPAEDSGAWDWDNPALFEHVDWGSVLSPSAASGPVEAQL